MSISESDTIRKLQNTANEAETIIAFLKKEIAELNSLTIAQNSKILANLKSECDNLEGEVLKSKQELTNLQKKNGFYDENLLPNADSSKLQRVPRSITNNSVDEIGFERLDLRTGMILETNVHPNASNLYVLTVAITPDPKVLTIVAGIRKYETTPDLFMRDVIVVCNLKPSKLRGVESQGMLLCAIGNDTVEPLYPPFGAKPGEIVVAGSFKNHTGGVIDKNGFDKIIKDFSINSDKHLMYKSNIPVLVKDRGLVHAKKIANCRVG